MNHKPALVTSLLLFVFTLLGSFSAAAISNDAEAVNKAGRQRMLSQRIALNYFMIGTNTNEAVAAQRTDASMAEFHSNLMELREYIKDPETAALLNQEAAIWGDYSALVLSKPTPAQGVRVLQLSDQMLTACQKVVEKLATKNGTGIPRLVDTAGRQRMLSQRLGKYYFAMMWKMNDPGLEANFNKTLQEFDSNMTALLGAPQNTPKIAAALARANTDWKLSKFAFGQYKTGRYSPFIIATTTESILKSMDDITAQYVALASARK